MTNLVAVAGWDNIVQLETNTFALGGVGGPMNQQAQALMNRTEYLNTQLGLKAPLANPTFTGVPRAPTATSGSADTQIASTNFVDTYFAKKASPTFTGTPAAPTAAPGTNTTQLASCAFVLGEVAGLNISALAPKASPVFTGTPQAPTAAPGTNTTQLATTAFVTTNFAPLSSPVFTGTPTAPSPVYTDASLKVANTQFVMDHVGMLKPWGTFNASFAMTQFHVGQPLGLSGGTYTLTLPNANLVPNGGCIIFSSTVLNAATDVVTITSAVSGVTNRITAGANVFGDLKMYNGNTAVLCSNGVDWTLIGGNLTEFYLPADRTEASGYRVSADGFVHQWGRTYNAGAGITVTLPFASLARVTSLSAVCEESGINGDVDPGIIATIRKSPTNPLTQVILTSTGNAGNARNDVYVRWNVWGYLN